MKRAKRVRLASGHAALLSYHFPAGRPETSSDASSYALRPFRGEHAAQTGLEGHLADWRALLRRSSQSLARILRRSQAHIFSTGLRSGEDGGTRHARDAGCSHGPFAGCRVQESLVVAKHCPRTSRSHGRQGCLFICVSGLRRQIF